MRFELTSEQKQFKQEVYSFVREILSHPLVAPMDERRYAESEEWKPVFKILGERGWLSLAWPKEMGGQERSPIDEYIFFNAALGYHQIPYPFLDITARLLDAHAREDQRKFFIPKILKGEILICAGLTEPEAGSDLASAKTRAVKDGDDYVINGQKIFTTFAEIADYIHLLAVTNPEAPPHKKFSGFVIPMDTPGISVQPLMTYGTHRTNYTFYDNVRVPKDWLVGEEGQGWYQLMTMFGFERLGLSPHGRIERYLDDINQWARETVYNGVPAIENAWIKGKMADIYVEKEVLRLLNFWAAWMLGEGKLPIAEASAQKAFGTEARQRAIAAFLEMIGLQGQLHENSKWAPLQGRLMWDLKSSVVYSIGGGVNEIQRDIAATKGLGLPRLR